MKNKAKQFMRAVPMVASIAAIPAFAQTAGAEMAVGPANVKFYGVADIYFGKMDGKLLATDSTGLKTGVDQQFTGLGSGGFTSPRLGVAVSAPFGEDYVGFFTIELGPTRLDQTFAQSDYKASVTNGLDKTRKSFVGVRGKFGEITAGRLQSPAYEWSFEHAPMSGALDPIYGLALAAGAGINSADRINDAIAYRSPKLGDFTIKAAYAFANARAGQNQLGIDDALSDNHRQNIGILAVNYDHGALALGAVYRSARDTSGMCVSASGATVKCATAGATSLRDGKNEWGVGAIYDFGPAKLTLAMQAVRPNAARYANTISAVGLEIPVGPTSTILSTYAVGNGKRDLTTTSGPATVDTKAQAFAVAYKRDLNQYLTWYAGVIYDKNGDNLFGSGLQLNNRTSAANYVQPTGISLGAAPGASQSGLITGLRVTF